MKAAVLWDVGQPLSIEEVTLDPPKAGEVHVKVGAAGICRSDLHVMEGEAAAKLPVVLGHEGAGTVLDIGTGVTSVKPGDRVILSFVPNCGRCFFCVSGRVNLCEAHAATGGFLYDGTTRLHKGEDRITHQGKVACFAQETVVPESGCIRIDDSIPMPVAAFIGCCVTTGVGAAMFTAMISPGQTVAVIGSGGVGLNVIQGARLLNASKIIAVDIKEGQLEFATKFGATHTVNSTIQSPVDRIREITNGLGADFVFEVFGSTETFTQSYEATRRGGTSVIVGLAPIGKPAGIEAMSVVRQEKTIKGSYYGSARPAIDMHTMVDLYKSGKIDIDGLVAREYHLDDINEAYSDLINGEVGRGVITTF
tara:strand:- start:1527 stop:2621 length:1095 start_codon:yes stop_codon:yes gene_type:complete